MKINIKIIFLFISMGPFSYAANVLQTKGSSAIIGLSDAEMQSLQPEAGKSIIILSSGKPVQANIKKVSNKKILLTLNGSLGDAKTVKIKVDSSSPKTSAAAPTKNGTTSKNASKKNWALGANLKYVTGSAAFSIPGIPNSTLKYSGFDVSGIGIYYFGKFGVGVEGEYSSLPGTNNAASATTTQIQMSLLGEYRINLFSVGALFTVFSNFKSSDSLGNETSLNGMGYGAYAAYMLFPSMRLSLDYKMGTYKLDTATITTSDIRFGAGYYF